MIFGIDEPERATRKALFGDGRWWSYDELSAVVARRVAELPARKTLVFLYCRNTVASVGWYLAALEGGHAVALLDAGLAEEFKRRLEDLYLPEIVIADGEVTKRGEDSGDLHPNLALLLSTSGSTGSPKFVRLTRRNVEANAESICAALAIQPEDRAIASLPIHYSYGLSVLNTHLLAGAAVSLTDDGLMSPSFWDLFRSCACTSFAGVPYSYQIVRRLGIDGLRVPTLHTMTQAGGKLHNDLISEFHGRMSARGGRFFVMYGQTEATARISVLPHDKLPEKLGSAGLAISNGSLEIADGELVYRGPNVMMGYATARADLARGDELCGCLHTGDMAELDAEGFVHIQGRAKRDAKLFGLRLNLDEIENLMRAHGPSAVTATDSKLVIFCEHGDDAAYGRFRHELAAKLKIHHQAFEFRRVERLPLNASGKIDYQKLMGRA